jgi:hypothetical protein
VAERFPIGGTLRRAANTYRVQFGRVTLLAFAVLGPLAALHAVADDAGLTHTDSNDPGVVLGVVAIALLTSIGSGLGNTFVSGVLDHVVHADRQGHEQRPLGQLAGRVPLGRLFVTATLVWITTVLSVVAAPVVVVLLSIAGPIVQIERRGPFAAMRRSARLVRPSFWRVALVVLPLLALEDSAVTFVEHVVPFTSHLAAEIAAEVVTLTLLGTYVVLVEVHSAHELLALERARRDAVPA